MMMGWTLGRYLATRFVVWFAVVLFGLTAIIYLFEVAELLRRGVDKDVALSVILLMGIFKLPETVDKTLPFVVLFAALIAFWRLTRAQELAVVRAAGLSAWQFLLPMLVVVVMFAGFNMTVLNPLGAAFVSKFRDLESEHLRRMPSFELTSAGLWLRQRDSTQTYLIQSEKVTLKPLVLRPIMVLIFDEQNNYVGRLDADEAMLLQGEWILRKPVSFVPGMPPTQLEQYIIRTNLTEERIQDSLAAPNTVSFWDLPRFVRSLEAIGLPAYAHQLRWQSLLAMPVLLVVMLLVAAVFSLRMTRHGGLALLAGVGIGVGTLLFAANGMLNAVGMTGALAVLPAAWAVPAVGLFGTLTALLFLEDG